MAKSSNDPKKKPKLKQGGGPARKPAPARKKKPARSPVVMRDSVSGSGSSDGPIILDGLTDYLQWLKDNPPSGMPPEFLSDHVALIDTLTLMLLQFLAAGCCDTCSEAGDGALVYCKDGKFVVGTAPMGDGATATWDSTTKKWYGSN